MKKQIVIVEGKNDVAKLQQVYPNISAISIGGSSLNEDVITYLKSVENEFEFIICTDPDYPGLQIRSKLEQLFPNASHVFIERNLAYSKNKKKIGLEHLDVEQIEKIFNNVYRKSNIKNTFSMSDLYFLNLVGTKNSQSLRNKVSASLIFGYVNAKTFLKRLNQSNITYDDLIKEVKKHES